MERGDLMKVLICSDSHRRLDYFQQVMELENPEIVIFAGDHSTDAIDMSLVYRDVLFAIVKGNTDMDDYESRDMRIFDLMGKKVFLTHGHLYNVKQTLEELEKKAHLEMKEIFSLYPVLSVFGSFLMKMQGRICEKYPLLLLPLR